MSDDTHPHYLTLKGNLTIAQAESLQETMLDALRTYPAIEIDCTEAEDIDVTFLQLLISAGRTALAWNKSLRFSSPPTGLLANTISCCGLSPSASDATSVADIFSIILLAKP